ncbi:NAD(P)/FAD-dependent oxidoreductase [Candidatus Villigracilis saccharophilus]|uniref:NAD(P)/FAD-dependent oxidoreductase n=1 Tax=Candidatus Villigracilis saccharophilus TaxID=3140684 RepID=UPI003136AFA1|nr:NAD(P)/FAD-dependent oxidoreductase [Anaerolineales bacterium]
MEKDILIIGGGPSGLSTALHLTKIAPHLSHRILILEKMHYPRPKLCAGGLVADAEIILQRLGLDVSEVPHVDASAAHFEFEGRGIKISVPKSHTIRVIRRNEFDHWLAKKTREAGIEIREGVTVKNIIPDKDGVTVETDQGNFCAQIVVGADGSNGITHRSVLPNTPVYTAQVLEVITPELPHHYEDEAILGRTTFATTSLATSQAYFDFFPVPDNIAGYVWDFPTQINGEPMRCWGIYDTNLLADQERPPLKKPLADEMARHGFNLDDHELKGHPIRWYDPFNPISVPRVLLVGDAVGADPIFGEGISMALGYGAIAAQEIRASIRRGEFSFSGYKRRLVWSGLGQTLFARWVITQIIYPLKWRWFQILLWRFLKPIVILVAWVFVLNWGKRIRT